MPAPAKAPTRAELEKVFGRPLTDAEYRGMLNINAAPQVAREGGAQPAAAGPMQPQAVVGGQTNTHYLSPAASAPSVMVAPYAAAIPKVQQGMHQATTSDAIATQPQATSVKPLLGLPATQDPDAAKKLPFWYSDQAFGAQGDVATPLEYANASKPQPTPEVVATMPPAPGTVTQQSLGDGSQVVPAPPMAAMIAPPAATKKEKK